MLDYLVRRKEEVEQRMVEQEQVGKERRGSNSSWGEVEVRVMCLVRRRLPVGTSSWEVERVRRLVRWDKGIMEVLRGKDTEEGIARV